MDVDLRMYPVLFVDDEEPNRIIFEANFGQDLNVIVAGSGEEALAILRETTPAVLIADQRMPGMTGVELAEIVREKYPEIVRVIITAYSDSQVVIDAINRGQVSKYLTKPWNLPELREYLEGTVKLFTLNKRVQEMEGLAIQSERMATLGQLASSIAHDLSTPISCLNNNLDSMYRDLRLMIDETTEPRAVESLRELQDMAQDCRVSLEEILHLFTSIRTSIRVSPKHEPVLMSTVIQASLKLVKTEVNQRAYLNVLCDPEVMVLGNASELTQIVMNLLVNAGHAIHGARSTSNRVELVVRAEDEQVILSVQDTGCGIPSGVREKIFNNWYTTRINEGGTGLGLSIVKRYVEEHKGTVKVDSTVGVGTIFTIYLPRYLPETD